MRPTTIQKCSDEQTLTASEKTAAKSRRANRPPADLFPLPLTPFETLMFQDDSRQYPRIFSVIVEFEGCLDPSAFAEAAREVVARHPLLSATVYKIGAGLCWFPTAFPEGNISFSDSKKTSRPLAINLRREPGFRIFGWTDGTRSEIRLEFHHAVSDGQGARRIIIDLTSIYASIVLPDDPNIRIDDLDYERLRNRGIFSRECSVADKPIPSTSMWRRLRNIYEFLSQQPTPLRGVPGDTVACQAPQHHVRSWHFDRTDVRRFRQKVRETRYSLNDVAIALLLNTIARWNRQHGESGRDRLYRILVPMDLRETGDERLPASNRLSFVFLTRPTSLCLDWPKLLETIRDEMDYIDEHGCKYNLIHALPIVQALPGVVPVGTRLPACFSTAVLTNLGNVLRKQRSRYSEQNGHPVMGNMRFLRASGVPPLRPRTHLGVGITMALDEMVLQSQTDSKYFSSQSAESFLRLFAESWLSWASSD